MRMKTRWARKRMRKKDYSTEWFCFGVAAQIQMQMAGRMCSSCIEFWVPVCHDDWNVWDRGEDGNKVLDGNTSPLSDSWLEIRWFAFYLRLTHGNWLLDESHGLLDRALFSL